MKLYFFTMLTLFSSYAVAQDTTPPGFIEKRIHKGDWSIGGDLSATYNTYNGLMIATSADVQYFWWDAISLGAVMKYKHAHNFDIGAAGIKGTYHFYEGERSTVYLSQEVTYNLVDYDGELGNRSGVLSTTGIGINYFLNPNMAIGPKLEFTKELGNGSNSGDSQLGLKLGFSLFF